MIKLDNISLYYTGTPKKILHDITWHIGADEKWILFGPNGSGKTKLLEIIAGYIYPSSGTAARFGETEASDIRDEWKRIGYVSTPMKERFSKNEAVIDIITSGAHATAGLYREPEPGEINHARELLASGGLADKARLPFGVLSDGEKQKTLMLRSLMRRPELLILDEPSMGLDISAREDLLETLESLSSGKTIAVIYVTHHIEEITPFFKDIFMLKEGTCRFIGSIGQGLSDERLSDIFGRNIRVITGNGRYYTTLS